MNEMKQIPNQLFELIESKPWNALTENEKEFILIHLSMETYSELHEMFMSAASLNKAEKQLVVPTSIKDNLDKTFKKQHQESYKVPLWQAAAVLLVMLGGFVYYTLNNQSIEKVIVNTIHDTIFVPKIVSTEVKTTDTVIVYHYVNAKTIATNKSSKVGDKTTISENDEAITKPVSRIRTLSHEEIKNSIHNLKNKSMFEDTLYQKIGYASI